MLNHDILDRQNHGLSKWKYVLNHFLMITLKKSNILVAYGHQITRLESDMKGVSSYFGAVIL